MSQYKIKAKPHAGQYEVHTHPARFKLLAAARRWGKTRLGVYECLDTAARGGRAWWVAPSYKMSEVGWRPLQRQGVLLNAHISKANRTITLPNRGEVTVRSADNPDSLRGEGLDKVVMDECAFMQPEAWFESLRPALSDRLGSAIFITTPKGRNWIWKLYQRGQDPLIEDWQSWQLPTSDNPYILQSEIDDARASMPEKTFQQEYLAEFLEGEGTVFRNIMACMNAPDCIPNDHLDHRIVMGADWAKQADFSAFSVGCADCKVELAIDRQNRIDYHLQWKRLEALCKRWRVNQGLVEQNSVGEAGLEALVRAGLPVRGFQTTAVSKTPLIENLALVLEQTEWQFLNDPTWTGELEAYERKVQPTTGRSTYSAPEGLCDDTVIARALMVHEGGRWFFS